MQNNYMLKTNTESEYTVTMFIYKFIQFNSRLFKYTSFQSSFTESA